MSTLTPVMSIAGAGLMPSPPPDVGVALVVPPALSASISGYGNVAIINKLQQEVWPLALSVANANVGTASISFTTLDDLLTLSANSHPGVTGVIPAPMGPSELFVYGLYSDWDQYTKYTAGNIVFYQNKPYIALGTSTNKVPSTEAEFWQLYIDAYAMQNIAQTDSNAIMGNGNLSYFATVFASAYGYVQSSNITIAATTANNNLVSTFDPATGGMNSLTTGCYNQITTDFSATSADLLALGNLISLATLDNLGLPGELLSQIGRVSGGIPPAIGLSLLAEGISDVKIQSLASGINTLTQSEEKAAYTAMQQITGNALDQVLFILRVTATGIANMAQLLDLKYILPNSYKTLITVLPTAQGTVVNKGLIPIYLPNGAVNENLIPVVDNVAVSLYTGVNNTNSYDILKFIIPPDVALAIKGFVNSLKQVKNIASSNLPDFAKSMGVIETNDDLPAVKNLITPVPSNISETYSSQLGSGTGPDGTILLSDVIGVISKNLFSEGFSIVGNDVNSLDSTVLDGLYQDMINTMNGVYGPTEFDPNVIIPSGPAAGTYSSRDEAFQTGLIPQAEIVINNFAVASPATTQRIDTIWQNMADELARENNNQELAQINFGFLNVSGTTSQAALSLTNNLHVYGVDIGEGGPNEILTKLANMNTLSGQCIIASLREGRNIKALQPANIQLDTLPFGG